MPHADTADITDRRDHAVEAHQPKQPQIELKGRAAIVAIGEYQLGNTVAHRDLPVGILAETDQVPGHLTALGLADVGLLGTYGVPALGLQGVNHVDGGHKAVALRDGFVGVSGEDGGGSAMELVVSENTHGSISWVV